MILVRSIVSGLLVVLTACGGGPTERPAPAPRPELAPGEHVWTTADGVAMPYTVTGKGDATVVLVHCWMCDRTFWSNQVPLLAESYRVVALDLPGHGSAGENRDVWTVSGYGDDVAGLLRALDLSDVVLVGHSMGGPVALRAAALSAGRVRGIVAVDTLQDAERDFSGEQVDRIVKAFEADYVGVCSQMVENMFPEEGSEEIEAYVLERGCRAEKASIGAALIRDFTTIDMKSWFSGAGVPIRAVNAAGPNPTAIGTNKKYADYDAVLMDGVGHYPHMTRPGAFNPLLLDAIERILEADVEPAGPSGSPR